MKQQFFEFISSPYKLPAVLHIPDSPPPLPAVIVCHPHPLHGGEMENNVVNAICASLSARNIIAMRFNFRSVYHPGEFKDGSAEVEDLRAALDHLLTLDKVDGNKIGLSGYSFGANIALRLAPDENRFQAIAAVSPPMDSDITNGLKSYSKPKLFICGGADQFVDIKFIQKQTGLMPEPRQLEIIDGADHFWWGYETKVGEMVASFFDFR